MLSVKAEDLRCEYLIDPVGVDEASPRFSWRLAVSEPARRGVHQSAYRILVATSKDLLKPRLADLWDSGQVASADTFGIAYLGKRLQPGADAFWKVRVFDEQGKPSPWSSVGRWTAGPKWTAHWIQHPMNLRDEAGSAPNNGFHGEIESGPDDVQWVQIDLGKSLPIDRIVLWPARPYDFADTPGFLFPVRFKIEVADDPSFANPRPLVADFIRHDYPNPGTGSFSQECEGEGRYVRLTVLKLAQRDAKSYSYALAEMQVFANGKNAALGQPVAANRSTESGAWSRARLTDGVTQSHGPKELGPLPATQLRKEFVLHATVRRARVFVSALGAYELRINGKRVGDHILAPEWTDYRNRVQYQGYDVTKLLQKGPNAVGAILGDGWYAGRIAWYSRGTWGRVPALLCQLEVETTDGARTVVNSDVSWRSTDHGPIRSSDILDGEAYDAGRETAGWDRPGFGGQGWSEVRVVKYGGAVTAQPNEPIRVVERLDAVAVTEPKAGVYVVDFGQNMVGWARARLVGKPGSTATLRYAEALDDHGTVYRDNLRTAAQTDTYRFAGSKRVVIEPHFTYHGFRYIEVTGVAHRPRPEDFTGMVFCSSSPEIGAFSCSDKMLDRLWKNILWTQRANLMSVPTDCPQRNERLGWMGDIQAFCQTAAYNMDIDGFVAKWAQDLRDAQSKDGLYPEYVPYPGTQNSAGGSPAWSDAGVFVPWTAYLNSGDKRLIEKHYSSATKYVDFLHRNNPNGLWLNRRGADFNDWLNGDTIVKEGWPTSGGAVPPEVLATAFMARSTQIVADMARTLGKSADAAKYDALALKSGEAFRTAYVDREGRVKGDTQAGYALALDFDLLPEHLRGPAAEHMVQAVVQYGDHLSTGIQTTHRLMLELTRQGYNYLAVELVRSHSFPSWGFNIDNGATTIWERWDGYVKGRGFQDPGMNSLNHWALGSVGEWMMKAIGGLWPGDEPGWAHPVIRPLPGGGLWWAKASRDSVHGLLRAAWREDKAGFSMEVTIPANTAATVYVPCESADRVMEGGTPAAGAPGVRFIRWADGAAVFEVQSGTYRFTASGV